MAVVNRKSAAITNRDATPQVANDPAVFCQHLKGFSATLETVSGDDIGSVYRFGQVRSSDYVRSLLLFCDDIGTTTIADFGLYQTQDNGGAVVDADFFGSAVSLKDGALNGSDITHESGAYPIENVEKPLWLALGLSSDPGVAYDICATLTAAADAAGTITTKCAFTQ